MTSKTLRNRAWIKLDGIRGRLALIYLVHGLFSSAAYILAEGPLSLSLADISLNVTRKKEVQFDQLFYGFSRFVKSFVLFILNSVFTFLWSLLFVVPGIVKSYAYSMSYFIMHDNPELKPNEARKRSIELMKGNKRRLFRLRLSFLGWNILSVMTCGVLECWVAPYRQTAMAEFYEDLIGNTTSEYAEPKQLVPPPTPMPTAVSLDQLETLAEVQADVMQADEAPAKTQAEESPNDSNEQNE